MNSTDEPVIAASGLSKSFRGNLAVNGLDLAVPRGSIYGLIGRNGAGKTTTLRMLMGLLRPAAGTARVLGHELWSAPRAIRQRVAYVSQEQQLPPAKCTADLCLDFSHLYENWDFPLAEKLAKRFGIRVESPMAALSGGDRRKVAVLLAFSARPEVIILDEPAAGLDPIARRQLMEEIVDFLGDGGERTVLFSTHILEDLERVAEHVGIMDRGRMLAAGPLEDLQSGMRRVQVVFDSPAVPEGFSIPGAMRTRVEGPVFTAIARIDSPARLEEIRALPGVRVSDFPLGLQDLFIELLGNQPENPKL
ncbi:MAG: ABC transporter ATP-binding protein [Luteolibacter sp.]|uniref:ABC transporter ATP-binding protein n=1 Tax=Luteolibacter sp. TaxID=1962973 RepID=UPI003262D9B2